jgi:hypothetical protein
MEVNKTNGCNIKGQNALPGRFLLLLARIGA